MNSVSGDHEITNLNYQYLMLAQKKLQENLITARHNLGLDEDSANFLSTMSIEQLQRLASSGISAIQFRFNKNSIPHLTNYVSGDDLAITQAVLSRGAN